MSATFASRVYEHLAALRGQIPALRLALIPGTARRWAQRDLTPIQRHRMDMLARAEREAKTLNLSQGIKSLGSGRAPLNLDVLAALADIEACVVDLEAAICERLGTTPLAGATTAERISRFVGLLDRIAAHEVLAEHVEAEAVRLHRQASRALGDTEPVRRLDARCPICGARSLRALPDREVVVCVNTVCRCADDDCPCNATTSRRHCWPYAEWGWLAEILDDELESV
ncbi:hypothetical protein ACFV0L_29260 [Streptosporangium canum]|uniref:hypothetical protein n=1 Tax=Streptosporangium canum TaxID=324952 RepID=UPI00367BB306